MAVRRLLILKCSARKRGSREPIPALERYDGPLWQVLRARLRAAPNLAAELDVYALSAAFGLVSADTAIAWYDQTMSPERAAELRPSTLECFQHLMQRRYSSVCLGLSQRYLRAMEGWEALVPASLAITITDGPLGMKLGQLRAWLEGTTWQPDTSRPTRLTAPASPRGHAKIAGVEVAMTRDEVLDRARLALAAGIAGADHFRDWYVIIDDARVAPKWLVTQLTGQPTTRFSASQARQFLLQLGVDIESVART